ncbi:MAG: Type secretion protein [Hyphomicrobiales bacterium]|nr:Type secretion protein [Hyphomicrobiales bacterium]
MNRSTTTRRALQPVGILAGAVGGLVGLFIISIVSNLLMLTGPLFMMQVYDRVLASRSVPTLVALTILVCALFGFYAFLEAMRSRMAIRFANVTNQIIGEKLFAASVQMKLVSGVPANADPVRDGDALRQFMSGPGPMALLDLPWLPIYLGLVFVFHPMLGWLATGGGVVITLLMIVNEITARRPSQDTNDAQVARQRQTEDARLNAETIIAMGMLCDIKARWAIKTRAMLDAQRAGGDLSAFFSSATRGFRFLLQSAVLAMGAYLVIRNELSGGLMFASSIIASRALSPVEQIVAQWRGFIGARQAYQRIRRVLHGTDDQTRHTHLPLPKASLAVTQMATAPAGSKNPILQGINFDLQAGDALGVIGLSGSGKSSLARALVGVWPSVLGDIRLDGAMLAHFDPSQIGTIIGYLPQRVELFGGTVAENIARFQQDAESATVIRAAKAANVHDIINQLPNGYDTCVGEQGDLLSAGQRQRIGLARALFGDPFLIVLDEPNSNLDAEGDAALTDAIRLSRDRGAIVIVIAHRPSAVVAVDKLLLLKAGRQAAFGIKSDVQQQITQQGSSSNVRTIKATA